MTVGGSGFLVCHPVLVTSLLGASVSKLETLYLLCGVVGLDVR